MNARLRTLSTAALAMVLSACQSQLPGPVAPQPTASTEAVTPQGTPASAAPEVPQVTAPSSLVLPGKVQGPDGPIAGAAVTVYALGSTQSLATGQTQDDGSFSITLPAEASGKLLKLVAIKDKATLVATTALGIEAPQAGQALKLLQAQPAIEVSLGSTLLTLALLPRLEALMATRPSPQTMLATLKAINAAAIEAAETVKSLPPADVTALLAVASPLGEGTVPATIAKLVTAAGSGFKDAFKAAADQVSNAIRDQIKAGATLPPGYDAGTLVFGGVTSPGASGAGAPGGAGGSGGSGGGSSGGGSSGGGNSGGGEVFPTTGDVTAHIAVQGGSFTNGKSTIGASVTHKQGAVLSRRSVSSGVLNLLDAGALGVVYFGSGFDSFGNPNHQINRLSPTGAPTNLTWKALPISNVELDSTGGYWYYYTGDQKLHHHDADGNELREISLATGFDPVTVALGKNDSVWATRSDFTLSNGQYVLANGVQHFSPAGDILGTVVMAVTPRILADGAGGLYLYQRRYLNSIDQAINATIKHVDASGNELPIGQVTLGNRDMITMVLDGTAGLWVLDNGDAVHHLTATGSTTLLSGTPSAIAPAGDGTLWVAQDDTLKRYTKGGNLVLTVPMDGMAGTGNPLRPDGQGGLWAFLDDANELVHINADGTVTSRTKCELTEFQQLLVRPEAIWMYDGSGYMKWVKP